MRNTITVVRALFMALLLLIAAGCATVSVPVNITHPAEVNLSPYRGVVMAGISGELSTELEAELRNILFAPGGLQMLDKSAIGQYKYMLRQTDADVAAEKASMKKGSEVADIALLTGSMTRYIDRKVESKTEECTEPKTKQKKACLHYTRTHVYTIQADVSIADVQTGIIIFDKKIKEEVSESTNSYDTSPANISEGSLKSKAVYKVRQALERSLRPWTEKVYAGYVKDKALPGLEGGIKAAQGGNLAEAARIFRDVAKEADADPSLQDKLRAMPYWNLGLALEYSGRYDDAMEAFRKAFGLSNDMQHFNEIEHAGKLKAEAEELKRQRGGK